MNCLARCPWPGNVRELSNLLERLAILFPEQSVGANDLPERYRVRGTAGWVGSGVSISAPVTELDVDDGLSARQVEETLEADGTVAEAARLLNMRRTTLVEKLRKYRLSA
jgi:sigma-54 specific flagellar transcriptional regulator A